MPVYRRACSSVAGASLTVFRRTQLLHLGKRIPPSATLVLEAPCFTCSRE
jgi:hypothetical protein